MLIGESKINACKFMWNLTISSFQITQILQIRGHNKKKPAGIAFTKADKNTFHEAISTCHFAANENGVWSLSLSPNHTHTFLARPCPTLSIRHPFKFHPSKQSQALAGTHSHSVSITPTRYPPNISMALPLNVCLICHLVRTLSEHT